MILWSDETKVELLNIIQRCRAHAAHTLKHHTCSEICLCSIMLWAIFDQQGLGILLKWSEGCIVPKYMGNTAGEPEPVLKNSSFEISASM